MKKDILGALTGALIGDGYARRNQLVIQHSIKQKEYLLYKTELLNPDNKYKQHITEVMDTKYPYIRLFHHSKATGRLREKLYVDGKKKLTVGILNQLQPIGLAIWYMDDGNLTLHKYPNGGIKSREVYWATDSFDYEDHLLFQSWLKRVYDIDMKINQYKKGKYYRTVLNATNANKLFDIIRPYVIPSMLYKIDMCYSSNPKRSRRAKDV